MAKNRFPKILYPLCIYILLAGSITNPNKDSKTSGQEKED